MNEMNQISIKQKSINNKKNTYIDKAFPKEYGRFTFFTEHIVLWTRTDTPVPDSLRDNSSSKSKLLHELGMQTPHNKLEYRGTL